MKRDHLASVLTEHWWRAHLDCAVEDFDDDDMIVNALDCLIEFYRRIKKVDE